MIKYITEFNEMEIEKIANQLTNEIIIELLKIDYDLTDINTRYIIFKTIINKFKYGFNE